MSAPAGKSVLARNTFYASLGYAVNFIVPLLVVPYTLHRVGREAFGVFAVLTTLGYWLGRLDFGIWAALPREVAARRAREDREGLTSLATTWFFVDLIFAAVIMGALRAAGREFLAWLLPSSDVNDVYPVLLAVGVQSVLGPCLRHLSGSLEGMQRVDLVQKVTLVVAPLQVAGLIFFLERGWGLLGMAVNGAIFSGLQIVAIAALLRRAGYPLTLEPGTYRASDLSSLVRFGWKLELHQLVLQGFRSDRLFMAIKGMPAILIGSYQIGSSMADRLTAGVQTLSSSVLPAVSDLVTRGERGRVVTLMMRATKYHGLAAFGLFGFLALFGPEVLLLWTGQPMPESAVVVRLMAAGFALSAITSPLQAAAAALGRPGLLLRSSSAGLAGAVLLYTTVGHRYDYRGLAGSVSVGTALAQVVFMIGFHGILEFRWGEWMGNAFLKPLAASAPLLAVYGAWQWAAPRLLPVHGRAQALAVAVPAFLLSAALAWVVSRVLRIVDEVDVDVLKSIGRRTAA